MRQSAQMVESSPAWKQEVNLRIAQHRGRKMMSAPAERVVTEGSVPESASAQAAARVAARYAKAPSYSEMIAQEARAAQQVSYPVQPPTPLAKPVDAAEPVAIPELTVPMSVRVPAAEPLDVQGPESPAEDVQRSWSAPFAQAAAQISTKSAPLPAFEIRWDTDLPVRSPEIAMARASLGPSIYEVDPMMVLSAEPVAREPFEASGFGLPGYEVVEPALPIHANLIHFPRELVAAHKSRPRRAEGIYAAADDSQLSIFEAEVGAVSSEIAVASVAAATGTHAWSATNWSSIRLHEEPVKEAESTPPLSSRKDHPEPSRVPEIRVAPMNRRILAGIVDFSLITGSFLTAAIVATLNTTALPSLGEMEVGSILALLFLGAFYQAFFLSLSRATPGMQYAGLVLSTFSGKRPGISQRCMRAGAVVVSLLPLGLGAVWALFDEQQMSWHDRLSRTYLRKA